MKRVLVTGMNSRACSPNKNRRDVMVSWLIAEVCRDLGYHVEHRNPTIAESYEQFDHVFLSLAPLHSLGSNRVYGALSAFLRCLPEQKMTIVLDDPKTANIQNGISTVYNDPRRLVKSFFNYKLEYDLANTPEWSSYLMQGVEFLHDYAWPTTLIPAFPWADTEKLLKPVPNVVNSVTFDPTFYLPAYANEAFHAGVWPENTPRVQWVTETSDEKWLEQQRIEFPLVRYGKGFDKRPDDMGLVMSYAESWGVLDRGEDHGWWTSRLGYAVAAGVVYCTKWQNVETLGEPFWELPDAVERMSLEEREELVEAQAVALLEHASPREHVRDTIHALVEKDA